MVLKITSIKIDNYQLYVLSLLAQKTGKTRSELIREGITMVIKKYEKRLLNDKRIRVIEVI